MQPLILASSSKPRQMLLQRLQIPFTIGIPDIDETPMRNEHPMIMVQRLAMEKAKAISLAFPQALIIGADQVGCIHNKMLTKPLSYENAFAQLELVSGQCVRFFIGMCLFNAEDNTQQIILETYDVYFRKLKASMIKNYLDKEKPFECAGSFKAEGLGIALVEKFEGDDFTALTGLPLIKLTHLLLDAGLGPI